MTQTQSRRAAAITPATGAPGRVPRHRDHRSWGRRHWVKTTLLCVLAFVVFCVVMGEVFGKPLPTASNKRYPQPTVTVTVKPLPVNVSVDVKQPRPAPTVTRYIICDPDHDDVTYPACPAGS